MTGRYFILVFFCAMAMCSTLAVDMNDFFPGINSNYTKVTWAHAVNNQALLNDTLTGDIMMIEADIVLGTLTNEEYIDKIPVMGHPPVTTSDLSLEMFLKKVLDYNDVVMKVKDGIKAAGKGIKLDFKSIEVFEASIPILLEIYDKMNFPCWINADILRGPINLGTPVDPQRFFNGSKAFPESTLSIGWTTTYGGPINNLSYSSANIDAMLLAIRSYSDGLAPVTFPVRAGMAARSGPVLERLLADMPKNTTITLWSGSDDQVDVTMLRTVIFSMGLDRVFIDVPEELLSQLDLGNLSMVKHLYYTGDAAYFLSAIFSIIACSIIGLVNFIRH